MRLEGAVRGSTGFRRLRSDRSYLVTGGLGGIGLLMARWLVERGAGAVVLNGRRPPDPSANEAISELRASGTPVRVEIADVADAEAVAGMVASIEEAEFPALGGLVHSAGALADRTLANQDWPNFDRVLGPKVLGAWNIHRATQGLDLDLFVLFSSFSGVIGNAGQTNHAAANAFLDQLAGWRRAIGLPGQAIAWGPWSELGEAEEERRRIAGRFAPAGIGWMTPQQALAALSRLIDEDVGESAVISVDWATGAFTGLPMLEELVPAPAEDAQERSGELVARLAQTAPEDRKELLIQFVRTQVQAVLRLPAPPAAETGFFDLGMDSLMAVELRTRVNRAFAGTYVAPNTVVFDHPTVERLADHLAHRLAHPSDPAPTGSAPQPEGAAGAEYERLRELETDQLLAEAEALLDDR